MALTNLVPWRKNRNNVGLARRENPVNELSREMNRLFEDFFGDFDLAPFGGFGQAGDFSPSVNVHEDDNQFVVSAELPGIDEKDVEISLDNNYLTLKGQKNQENEEKGKNYYRSERRYGSFQRTIPLSAEIDQDKVEAEYKKGVLKITLPKTPEAKSKKKKIAVKGD